MKEPLGGMRRVMEGMLPQAGERVKRGMGVSFQAR